MQSKPVSPLRIALFASGGGSNVHAILEYFAAQHLDKFHIALICTNNPQSGVWELGSHYRVPVRLLSAEEVKKGDRLLDRLRQNDIDFIALAGYIRKIPDEVVAAYPKRIVNIHPSLLPDFGGKGMYGIRVHEAALAAGVSHSGMTIHYVNDKYDEGDVIFQDRISIDPTWSPVDLQLAVLKLEHAHYPVVIRTLCQEILEAS